MVIHRISGQKRKTLIEFYEPFDSQKDTAKVALPAMQEFLKRLMEVDGPELYAFTSHYRLNFVATDSHTVPVIARVMPGCTSPTDGPLSPLIHILIHQQQTLAVMIEVGHSKRRNLSTMPSSYSSIRFVRPHFRRTIQTDPLPQPTRTSGITRRCTGAVPTRNFQMKAKRHGPVTLVVIRMEL